MNYALLEGLGWEKCSSNDKKNKKSIFLYIQVVKKIYLCTAF